MRSQKRESWNLIRRLAEESLLLWELQDLSNVLHQSDKRRGKACRNWLLSVFQVVLSGLIDMNFVDHPYTWEKGKRTSSW